MTTDHHFTHLSLSRISDVSLDFGRILIYSASRAIRWVVCECIHLTLVFCFQNCPSIVCCFLFTFIWLLELMEYIWLKQLEAEEFQINNERVSKKQGESYDFSLRPIWVQFIYSRLFFLLSFLLTILVHSISMNNIMNKYLSNLNFNTQGKLTVHWIPNIE